MNTDTNFLKIIALVESRSDLENISVDGFLHFSTEIIGLVQKTLKIPGDEKEGSSYRCVKTFCKGTFR